MQKMKTLIKAGSFRFVAMNVPIKIPIATAIPKDLTNSKLTALYFI